MARLIKTEADYEKALARIDRLMGAEPGSDAADELELLVTLVELYEEKHYPIGMSDPVEAIKFIMEQNNLTPTDLAPFIGNRSRVSEVLSGRRPLSLSMMRALHKHLGIPADILLIEPESSFPEQPPDIEWEAFPLREMAKRGWISPIKDLVSNAEEIMRDFIARAGGLDVLPKALRRQGIIGRTNIKTDNYALWAWYLRVLQLAKQSDLLAKYQPGTVDLDFLRRVAKLSSWSMGPEMAREFLSKHGIHLIVLRHLPQTYLDGAVMLQPDGTPVVGLSLRYDRVDHFWFALLHELSHLGRHFADRTNVFVDDHSLRKHEDEDLLEREADEWAQEALLPSEIWENSPVRRSTNENMVKELAGKLEIHPAIIAGRIRYEQGNYRLLTRLVGQGEIGRHFESMS